MGWLQPPPPTAWGKGAIAELGPYLERRGRNTALIVSDQGVVEAGLVGEVTEHLSGDTRTFDTIEPNPSREMVDEVLEAYRGEDVVIGIGGGSVMDAAKAATAIPMVEPEADQHPLDALLNWPVEEPLPEPETEIPLVLVPTTAGTGSETGPWAVISDHERGEKLSVGHRSMAAEAVILDPALTTTLPPGLTASSGFDVIAHAVEAYVATGRTRISRPAAEAGYRGAVNTLPNAVEHGDSLESRRAMLAASYLAGVAMNNAGLGAVHGISHAIGGLYDTPHGHTNALLLPRVIRRNAARSEKARAGYADLVDGRPEPGAVLAERLSTLRADIGLDSDLPGLPSDPDWQLVAERAIANVNTETNPAELDEADVIEICNATFH